MRTSVLRGLLLLHVYAVPPELLFSGVPHEWEREGGFCRQDPGYAIETDHHLLFKQLPQEILVPLEEANMFYIPHYRHYGIDNDDLTCSPPGSSRFTLFEK